MDYIWNRKCHTVHYKSTYHGMVYRGNIVTYMCFYVKVEYISKEMDDKKIENHALFLI